MSRGINRVTLIGNLGNDPECKYTQGGMAVVTLSLATTSVRKDKDGQQQERTEWHRCKAFGKTGEIIAEYAKKGSQLYIEGSIRYDKFTGSDGVEKYSTDIVVDQFQFLGGKNESAGGGSGGTRGGAPNRERPAKATDAAADEFADSDIPFVTNRSAW